MSDPLTVAIGLVNSLAPIIHILPSSIRDIVIQDAINEIGKRLQA